MIKKLYFGAFASLIASAISCSSSQENTDMPTTPILNVDVYIVDTNEFDNEIVKTANILPNETVLLKANLAGQVTNIKFVEGEFVRAGQSIITMDSRLWNAELLGVKAELENLEKSLARKVKLLEVEGASQEEVDDITANIQKLKAEKLKLEVNIDLANIKAPFSGTMGLRNFSKGAYLNPGDDITTITQTDELKVDFSLPEQVRSSVEIGKEITVRINDKTYPSIIYAISPVIETSSRTFNVRAKLLPKEDLIMPGIFAQATIKTDLISDALLVPTQAVVPEINDQTIYVLKNGVARKRKVKLGNRTNALVHILEGVDINDTIVTTGLLQIKDGAPVNIQSITK